MTSERLRRARNDRIAFIAVFVITWAGGLYILADTGREYALAKASVPTECTVVSSTVAFHRNWGEKGSDSHSAQVVLDYEVDGRRYQRTDDGPHRSDPVDGRVKCEAEARAF